MVSVSLLPVILSSFLIVYFIIYFIVYLIVFCFRIVSLYFLYCINFELLYETDIMIHI